MFNTVREDGEKERAFGIGGGEKEGFLPAGEKLVYTINSVFLSIREWGGMFPAPLLISTYLYRCYGKSRRKDN